MLRLKKKDGIYTGSKRTLHLLLTVFQHERGGSIRRTRPRHCQRLHRAIVSYRACCGGSLFCTYAHPQSFSTTLHFAACLTGYLRQKRGLLEPSFSPSKATGQQADRGPLSPPLPQPSCFGSGNICGLEDLCRTG